MSVVPEVMKPAFERLVESPALDPSSVDYTSNPDTAKLLRDQVGEEMRYFAEVEGGTDDYMQHLTTLHPDSELHQLITPFWHAHEMAHYEIENTQLGAIGMSPAKPPNGEIPLIFKLMGEINHKLPSVDHAVQIGSIATAGMHEFSVQQAYGRKAEKLRGLGEPGFAEAINDIGQQEAYHVAIYTAWLKHLLSEAKDWQVKLGRNLVRASWQPVGAKKKEMQARFGGVAENVLGEENVLQIADRVYKRFDRLLYEGEGTMPRYIQKRIKKCLEDFREQNKTEAVAA